jgi:hypothetical protein
MIDKFKKYKIYINIFLNFKTNIHFLISFFKRFHKNLEIKNPFITFILLI